MTSYKLPHKMPGSDHVWLDRARLLLLLKSLSHAREARAPAMEGGSLRQDFLRQEVGRAIRTREAGPHLADGDNFVQLIQLI
jgi:hypothetical protein